MTGLPIDLRRTPRRYPRVALRILYGVEWFLRVALRGKKFHERRLVATLRVRRETIHSWKAPPTRPLRIVQLSDFHAGPFLDSRSIAPVLERAADLDPDVVVLTGDYLTHVADEAIELAPAFASLVPRLGAFLVFGNHDYRHRREHEIAVAFSRVGYRALRNEGVAIEFEGRRFYFAGIEDVEEGKVIDLDAALAGRREDDFTVLLAHHPDVAWSLNDRPIDLQLSGHTHGGQIVIGGRSIFGRSLKSAFRVGLTRVGSPFLSLGVTSGIGTLMIPLRIGAPPEIVLYEIARP